MSSCEISKTFNKHYINIVEKSYGNKPDKIGTPLRPLNDSDAIDKILKQYKNHSRFLKIRSKFGSDLTLS